VKRIWAEQALLPGGWARNVAVDIAGGAITSVTENAEPSGHRVATLLPAPANLHSHAFQRAMAGMTERRGANSSDSFWTWRQLMFRFLDRLTPEDVEAIAAFVQMEMLEAGYGTNVEFHYLHHQPGGTHYARLGEMSARIAAAAATSGIGLTLLPVHYQFGGCDGRPLTSGQARFGTDPETFARLVADAADSLRPLPDARVGIAPHSLRAVAAGAFPDLVGLTDGPIHMHLAEQKAEVEEVVANYGARPVEYTLDKLGPDGRWCFIHITQMQPHETEGLARTGAVAGLCPITESSLGDGIFDGIRWRDAGGKFGIGSDSNIRIALAEELRTLDYSQRLRDHSRAAYATATVSTGRALFDGALAGGAQAAGRNSGRIAEGDLADLLALDGNAVDLAGTVGDETLDTWIFAGDDRMVRDVWSAGRHMVTEGRHIRRDSIEAGYRKVMAGLRAKL